MGAPFENLRPLTPAPALNGLNLGQDKGNIGCVLLYTSVEHFSQCRSSIPHWITFIKPRPQAGENVITLLRDNHLALDIVLEYLPGTLPAGYNGIKVHATASVKNCADTSGVTLLEFRIPLYGAITKQRYEFVCAGCQRREGKRRGTHDLVDFKIDGNIIEPKDGSIRTEFVFCCYPQHHGLGDAEYLCVRSCHQITD